MGKPFIGFNKDGNTQLVLILVLVDLGGKVVSKLTKFKPNVVLILVLVDLGGKVSCFF